MKRLFPTVSLSLVSLLAGFPQNPKLKTLPDNTWMVLDSAGPADFSQSHYFAYSSGTYDRKNHQFLVFGGGHWDGWKNDVLAFDIATDTWKSMYSPDPSSDYSCGNVSPSSPGMLMKSGRPASRHTYEQLEFMDHLGKMVIFSGTTYSTLWNCGANELYTNPKDTWLYDYAANQWEYKNLSRVNQPGGTSSEGYCSAYDPVGKLYYALKGAGDFWSYSAETDRWSLLNPAGTTPSGYAGNLIADRKRGHLWRVPYYYDPVANRWSSISGLPSGLSTGGYGGVGAYDEVNDAFVYMDGGRIFVYHIAQNQWETLSPAGTPGDEGAGTYGRFFYDPVDNVHITMQEFNYRPRVWAYRYKGPAPTAVEKAAPAAPSADVSVTPNPVQSVAVVRVALAVHKSPLHASIYDSRGRRIATFTAAPEFAWDTRKLPAGVYLIRARAEGLEISKRLVVQK